MGHTASYQPVRGPVLQLPAGVRALALAAAGAAALLLSVFQPTGLGYLVTCHPQRAPAVAVAASLAAVQPRRGPPGPAAAGPLFSSVSVISSVSSSVHTTYFQRQRANEVLALKLTLVVQQILAAHVAIKVGMGCGEGGVVCCRLNGSFTPHKVQFAGCRLCCKVHKT